MTLITLIVASVPWSWFVVSIAVAVVASAIVTYSMHSTWRAILHRRRTLELLNEAQTLTHSIYSSGEIELAKVKGKLAEVIGKIERAKPL